MDKQEKFCLNGNAIERDRIAKSRAFVFPHKVNEFVGRDNCCTSLCGDLAGIADFVGMPRRHQDDVRLRECRQD